MFSSCQLLLAVAMAADPACVLVVREVVPVLVQRLSQSQPAHRRVLVEMVTSFAGVAQQFGNQEGMVPRPPSSPATHTWCSPAPRLPLCSHAPLTPPPFSAVASPLEPYKDMLLHTLLSALGGDQLELKAPALRLAACVFSMLSGPEVGCVCSDGAALPSHTCPMDSIAAGLCSVCVRASCEQQRSTAEVRGVVMV